MPIDLHIEGGEELASAGDAFSRAKGLLRDGLVREAQAFGLDSVARAKKDYLSGPRPERLGVVTGRLRSSIASQVDQEGDNISVAVGTNVKYAPAHELGFEGTLNVPAHLRVIKKAFGRPLENTVVASVSGHTRRVSLRARPFIRPAMMDALRGFELNILNLLGRLDWAG